MKTAGIILMFACMVVGGAIYVAYGGVDEDPRAIFGGIVMAGSVGGMLLYYRGRQRDSEAISTGLLSPLRDNIPDVLYLRAFRTDPSSLKSVVWASLATEEEQLAVVLKAFGDLVAVGRPGERLPVPGASRMYATDSEWQDLVIEQMRSARLVVIRAGAGPGLLWEVKQAFRTVAPEDLLILVLGLPLREYQRFAGQVLEGCGIALPALGPAGLAGLLGSTKQRIGDATPGFVTFTADWHQRFLPLPFAIGQTGFNDLRKPFSIALRPVFDSHGVSWRALSRFS